MKKLRFIFGLAAILLAGCAARPARAQFIGFVSPQTVQQTLAAPGTTCSGGPQTYKVANIGQTQHYATIISANFPVSMVMEIDGVDGAGNVVRISDQNFVGSTNFPTTLPGSGYYPIVQILINCSPNTATYTLDYSGASATPLVNTGTYLSAQIDKAVVTGQAANGLFQAQIQTPFGISAGELAFRFTAAGPAGSTVAVSCISSQTTIFNPSQTFNLATGTGLQLFPINLGNCPILQINYVNGGASATTFSVEFIFSPPGYSTPITAANLTAPLNASSMVEKGPRWGAQTNSPSAGTQATTSKAAGSNGTRHVADCVTWSAGASTAPTATTLTINLRDGATGTGTILWQTEVTAAATAAQHGQSHTCGLNLIGSTNTAMTLEFAAGLTNESESVALTGYDVQ